MPKDVWHTFYVCENGWLSEENILQGIKDVHPKMLYYIKAFYK